MTDQHILTRHRDIQNWVTDRRGIPAITRVRDRFGEVHAQLKLSFDRTDRAKPDLGRQEEGVSPCSWTAWLAELDRQQLALRISDEQDRFELIERRGPAN
ncbi:hypothetical protein [uncultured Devosia sp.]|uniref:hypothetical protein n=1 Tax=uncultured Devosia sp. TaxID=211434 RepID=UPI0035CB86D3